MRERSWKYVTRIAAVALGVGCAFPAHAITIGGFLGAPQGSTDVYGLTCPDGTRSVRARVNEANAPGIQVSVTVINPVGRAGSASAVNGGLSAVVILAGEAGNYLVSVHKDAAGGEGYNVTLDCHNSNGTGLGIVALRVQNQ